MALDSSQVGDVMKELIEKLIVFWRQLSLLWQFALSASGVVIVLLGIYKFLTPHVAIDPGVVGSDVDAAMTEFVFNNQGEFSIRNVIIKCEIRSSNRKFVSEGNVIVGLDRPIMIQGIAELVPGRSATRNCGAGIVPVPFPATFDVSLEFDWPFYWWRVKAPAAHFIGVVIQHDSV